MADYPKVWLQSCPVCQNEWEFRTKKDAEKAWRSWLAAAKRWVAR